MSLGTEVRTEQLADELRRSRDETDKLFLVLRDGCLYDRPVPERHRLIFYLGHLEAFDWNQIARWELGEPSFHPTFDKLFEFGIDPPVGQAPSDQPSDWPSVEEVKGYIGRLRSRLDDIMPRASEEMLHMAIEHRLMHAETLAYLLHNLPQDRKSPPALGPMPVGTETPLGQVEIPGGSVTLGRRRDDGFGWDNEFEEHRVSVDPFVIDQYKVTNGQYLQFVEQGAKPPHFWQWTDGEWWYRCMFGTKRLKLDKPVYVTHAEATAYAQWRGKKLPTEAQFHRAAYGTQTDDENQYPWGNAEPTSSHGNFGFQYWDPVFVYATPAGDSAFGVSQMVGNGWEWTSTPFAPFPGFEPRPSYAGYSQPFFDGKHFVLKGASPRTCHRFLRRSFRNWFRDDYPYVYATFRCIQ